MASNEQLKLKEDDAIKPWSFMAQYKARIEEELKDLDLNYTILRLPVVYGPADKRGLSQLIIKQIFRMHILISSIF